MTFNNDIPDYPYPNDDGDVFPPFTRPILDPLDENHTDGLGGEPYAYEVGNICRVDLADTLLEQLRLNGQLKEAQHEDDVPLTKRADPPPTQQPPPSSPPTTPPSGAPAAPPKKKNKNDSSDHQALLDRLNKKPHVVEFKGVVLDRNERLKIIAAVAICESGKDPFTAENQDSEFHMPISQNVSYAHIVHIGLSYGIIQFTQDSGALGRLLQRMKDKDPNTFAVTFGDNNDELITLTTSGIEVKGVDYASGQAHWNSIRKSSEGRRLSELARMNKLPVGSEIRGKRVQPIATNIGGPKQDLWEGAWKQRFVNAGKIDAFQEAQLEFAVEGYMNPALKFCKDNNIRSALGIAFVAACAIRGAPKGLITGAAAALGLTTPFADGADEKKAVQYISDLNMKKKNLIGGKLVQKDEIIRAKKLLKDETGFLAEDLYWVETYVDAYDKK
ncbi:hypothetical protein KDX08_22955 [Burkholderia cenocepacia]|uniref:hypothetical protein n=1 Tax=Burkholderia cenocepacia TaxID=95486 RepID=UPI0012AEC978|nr:hypothetical protein [Burkholderia cenocepacia]MBR7995307.1 hypothetical protein [Burkholderia cenocepacia]